MRSLFKRGPEEFRLQRPIFRQCVAGAQNAASNRVYAADQSLP